MSGGPAEPRSRPREVVALFLYGLLMRLLWPFAAVRWGWRARREPGYALAFGERFGFYRHSHEPGAVWIHAVSLGETRAAEPLIAALRQARPRIRLLLTHGTATGREAGRPLLRPDDSQTWLPIDSPGAVRRFLAHHRPVLGVLMETEIWPCLQRAAADGGVPMVLANARLSARSLRQAQRFAALLRPAAARLSGVLAQSAADRDRLAQAGAPQGQVMGNLKFDLRPDAALLARGQAWRAALGERPVVLAAVWREGEDADLLQAWHQTLVQSPGNLPSHGLADSPAQTARPAHPADARPQPLLWIVPRHPQRFDEVATLIAAAGFTLSRRSQWIGNTPDAAALAAQVWLGDTLREMPSYYAAADVALLGGSFAPLGGQNLIEAAACGCPVLMGPHTFNFQEAAALALEAGAARRCDDLGTALAAASAAIRLPSDEALAQRQVCREFAQRHQGAAERMAHALLTRVPVQR